MPQGRKNNQLMGAMQQEQQVNITDHATRYEEVVLNPLMEMVFEFDQQFRTSALMIAQRGEIGVKAKMEEIAVPQWGQRFFFRWAGTEYMQSLQRSQQQIAFMNVAKGVPPQQLNGLTFDASPILLAICELMFGPDMAPRVLIDKRNMYAIDPDVENEILHNGMPVEVHEADDDIKHLQSHIRAANVNGDTLGLYKTHMGAHMMQLQKKQQMQMAQAQGMPGGPGGAGQPGNAGAPRPGAMPSPAGGRPMQQPPGSIQTDAMPGAVGRG
jgi:hypothetical protein